MFIFKPENLLQTRPKLRLLHLGSPHQAPHLLGLTSEVREAEPGVRLAVFYPGLVLVLVLDCPVTVRLLQCKVSLLTVSLAVAVAVSHRARQGQVDTLPVRAARDQHRSLTPFTTPLHRQTGPHILT